MVLQDQIICITGKLSSMSRDDAVARIHTLGGTFVAIPTPETTTVVVGEGGGLLGEDGRLTRSLQLAQQLQDRGRTLEIVTETDWIAALGPQAHQPSARYVATQLARMVGVRAATLRRWDRAGLLTPTHRVGRLGFYGFRQLAHARALKALHEAGVPTARIVESMRELQRWLPDAVDPTRLASDGDALVVETDRGDWIDARGQLQLNFDSADHVREGAAPSVSLRALPSRFEEGVRAEEEGRLEDARAAYERSIAVDGVRAETCFNLGNVLHALDRTSEAASRFREAVSHETDYVEAWNNLGNTLDTLGEHDEAMRAFRHALAIEPLYADAHFNIAQALEAQGAHRQARSHWKTYLSLDHEGAWADEARRRLRDSLGE